MKRTIAESYPHGWFVAIADSQVIAAAATFRELEGALQAKGIDPKAVVVAEAGVDYPEAVTICDQNKEEEP